MRDTSHLSLAGRVLSRSSLLPCDLTSTHIVLSLGSTPPPTFSPVPGACLPRAERQMSCWNRPWPSGGKHRMLALFSEAQVPTPRPRACEGGKGLLPGHQRLARWESCFPRGVSEWAGPWRPTEGSKGEDTALAGRCVGPQLRVCLGTCRGTRAQLASSCAL